MVSVCFSVPTIRAFDHQRNTNLMLSSNCVHSLPRRPQISQLSASSPRFRASKLTDKSSFAPALSFRVSETHRRFSTKKWKISCFRNEELSSESPNSEASGELLHESEQSEINKPTVGKRNWASSLKEAVDSLFKVIGKPWTVPWTAETILQVTLLWILSFWFVGSWLIPFGAHIVGFSKESLTFRGQALFSLLTDVTEGLAGILILHRCLSRFCPLPSDWFKFSLRGNWMFDVLLGCFLFPLVNRLSQFNLDLLPVLPSTPVTLSSVEQSIMARDPIAMALYALVLVVCAPLWEEIVFRGFLLPSLTKYMPVWSSILLSSVAFALAHFNVQRMLPLIFLGVVMGVTYTRSRNLLPSMLLHSLWNGFVFLDLMK
ncbi:CAAX amino terminal protease family protein [Perilla frutescens var. frutescens]|nr:CAAX amino terminal protease family protein [Perilla frutescens var. frutescens]